MDAKNLLSVQVVSAWLLILSSITFVPAGLLYWGRAILKRPAAQSRSYLYWERGIVIAAILFATLGWVLLGGLLEAVGDGILSSIGMTIFLIGAVLIIAAETWSLNRQEWLYTTIVVAVILIFLGEAAFGGSILRTGILPGWVGWTTIIWNLGWLVILPIARSKDIYYPWLHYVTPLIIGIALLGR